MGKTIAPTTGHAAVHDGIPGTPSGGTRIRLLVVDDHPVVRSGIVGMLAGEEDLEVVGQAANGRDMLDLLAILTAQGRAPQVVLMDLRMPVMDGVEATRAIRAGAALQAGAMPDSADMSPPYVVILTTYDTDGDILRAVEAGATGYLLKDAPREDILAAVRAAAVGQSALSPTVTTRLVGATRASGTVGRAAGARLQHGRAAPADPRAAPSAPLALSPREREVLAAVARGLSNPEVGAELFITEATVKTHLLRAYGKLGVDSRTAAVTEALRRGLLDLG